MVFKKWQLHRSAKKGDIKAIHLFETVGSPTIDSSYKNPYLTRCKSTSGGHNNSPPIKK